MAGIATNKPSSPVFDIDGPLFDENGFANYRIIGLYMNQIFDKMYILRRLQDKATLTLEESDSLKSKCRRWMGILQELEYMRIVMDGSEKTRKFIEDKENEIDQIKVFLMKLEKENILTYKEKVILPKEEEKFILLFLDLQWKGQIQTRVEISTKRGQPITDKFIEKCTIGKESPLLKGQKISSFLRPLQDRLLKSSGVSTSIAKPEESLLFEVEKDYFTLIDSTLIIGNIEKVLGMVTKNLAVLQVVLQSDWFDEVIVGECGIVLNKE